MLVEFSDIRISYFTDVEIRSQQLSRTHDWISSRCCIGVDNNRLEILDCCYLGNNKVVFNSQVSPEQWENFLLLTPVQIYSKTYGIVNAAFLQL
jgi:hypothetical protein